MIGTPGPHGTAPGLPDPATADTDRVVAVSGLTKRFGSVRAVENLTFTVRPGRVTGFLGPNGAGKTTTLRMLLGLVRPTAGTATVGGRRYADLAQPQRVVGAALEASDFHPGRTARDHLRVLAAAMDLDRAPGRVEEMLALVGLTESAGRRVGGYSLGMRQRLALASALLGDPGVLLLDEPANGLDPQGIVWLRELLRSLAAQGRTVLVSSHVLAEVEQTVDDVIIISHGRLVRASTLDELAAADTVHVAGPDTDRLRAALAAAALDTRVIGRNLVEVTGATTAQVGHVAFEAGVELHRLEAAGDDLERTFLRLVSDGAEEDDDSPGPGDPPAAAAPGTPEPTAAEEAAATTGEEGSR